MCCSSSLFARAGAFKVGSADTVCLCSWLLSNVLHGLLVVVVEGCSISVASLSQTLTSILTCYTCLSLNINSISFVPFSTLLPPPLTHPPPQGLPAWALIRVTTARTYRGSCPPASPRRSWAESSGWTGCTSESCLPPLPPSLVWLCGLGGEMQGGFTRGWGTGSMCWSCCPPILFVKPVPPPPPLYLLCMKSCIV